MLYLLELFSRIKGQIKHQRNQSIENLQNLIATLRILCLEIAIFESIPREEHRL